MKQFNGKHSCVFCKCAGVPRERRRMVRDWPPGDYMPRTHLSIVDDAKEAVATAEAVSVFVLSCAMSTSKISRYCTGLWCQGGICLPPPCLI